MLRQRVVTASVLAPVALLIVFFAPLPLFSLAMTLVVLIGAWEWSNFIGCSQSKRLVYVAFIAVLNWLIYLSGADITYPVLISAACFWLFALTQVLRYPDSSIMQSVSIKTMAGLFVLLPAWVAMVGLRSQDQGGVLIAFLFSLVWGADIGAYFAGKRFGRNKLMPKVSPGKTLEGLAGGLFVCAVLAIGYVVYAGLVSSAALLMILIALLVGLVSVLGDLFESLMKRDRGIKDSGTILPGHGGVLDRIDSLTAAAPIFFLGVTLAQIF